MNNILQKISSKMFAYWGYLIIVQVVVAFLVAQNFHDEGFGAIFWPVLQIVLWLKLIALLLVLKKSSSTPLLSLAFGQLVLLTLGTSLLYVLLIVSKPQTGGAAGNHLVNLLRMAVFILYTLSFSVAVFFQAFYRSLSLNVHKTQSMRRAILGAAIAFMAVILANYSMQKFDLSLDLTRLGKFSLSVQAKEIIKNIEKEVKITAFYNDIQDANVRRESELYLKDLKRINPKIQFLFVDAFKDKDIALEKKISANGQMVVEAIDLSETDINKRLRSQKIILNSEDDLKKLEREVISAILAVTTQRKKLYFLQGHGEFSSEGPFIENLVSFYRAHLKINNYDVEELSVKGGYPKTFPQDMAALLIINPQSSFSGEEQKALVEYFQNGGRIFLSTDLGTSHNVNFLLDAVGIHYDEQKLISESHFPPDKADLVCFHYSEHPITAFLMKLSENSRYSLFSGSGALIEKKVENTLANLSYDFFVKSHHQTFTEKDYTFKDKNQRGVGSRNLAVAISTIAQKEVPAKDSTKSPIKTNEKTTGGNSRLVVFADSNFLSNKFIRSATANGFLAVNSLKWLVEDDKIMALLDSVRKDEPVKLSPQQKEWVRYSLLLLWPGLIVALGLIYRRRKNRHKVGAAS